MLDAMHQDAQASQHSLSLIQVAAAQIPAGGRLAINVYCLPPTTKVRPCMFQQAHQYMMMRMARFHASR